MNLSQLAGATSGLLAVGLAVIGLLILLPVSARLAFVIRRPGKGRIAKGLAAGALVLLLCGALLFLAADLTDGYPTFRHLLDAVALWASTVMLVVAAWVGVRAGRRRAVPAAAGEPSLMEKPRDAGPKVEPPGAVQG